MEQINRPTFLTVLCILTFIGSGWGIFNAISSYSSAEMAVGVGNEVIENVIDDIEDNVETEEDAAIASKILGSVTEGLTVENVKNMGIASGISSILTLLGAILMWSLSRKGFWLYLIGTAVAIVAPMMIYDGILGAIASGWVAFIGVIFCVLYGVNLKHLTNP